MRQASALLAAAALSTAVLSGCSGGNAYCDSIKDAQSDIGAVSNASDLTVGDFDKAADAFEDIAAESPDDVKSEWEKTAKTLGKTSDALKEAGAKSDTKLLDAASNPDFAQAAQSLQGDLSSLTSDMQKISKNVQSECDIDLSQNGGGS